MNESVKVSWLHDFMMIKIEAAEYFLIAEAILNVDAERLARHANVGALLSALDAPFAGWGGYDLYPSLAQRAAVLCSRLVRNRPLRDGNKRAAYVTMLEFVVRNGGMWVPPDPEDAAEQIERLATRKLAEAAFTRWVARQLA